MTPDPKPRRISREEAIAELQMALDHEMCSHNSSPSEGWEGALRYALRALKREQKAADAKKKEAKR